MDIPQRYLVTLSFGKGYPSKKGDVIRMATKSRGKYHRFPPPTLVEEIVKSLVEKYGYSATADEIADCVYEGLQNRVPYLVPDQKLVGRIIDGYQKVCNTELGEQKV